MIFGQPLFLIALTAIAVPVIVHLFNFRKYKRIYFTNVRYLSEITQETKKRNELKHLLILAARILAITAIVLAFARPFIPSQITTNKISANRYISVFLDNSFSMESLNTNGSLLDEAKQKAVEIAKASNPSDLFQLVTGDFEGRHQRFVNRDEFLNLVNEVKISPAVRDLSDIMKRQSEILSGGGKAASAYIISDFQKSIFSIPSKPDSMVTWFFVPVKPAKAKNLYIDSVWFDNPSHQPEQQVKLNVRIKNSSDDSYEKLPLKLMINGVQKAVGGFSISASGENTIVLPYTNGKSGIQTGRLEITDYPVTWDDQFFISYNINPAISILCLNENTENRYLNALFGDDSAFVFKNASIKQPDFSSFSRYSLIILNGITSYSSGMITELNRFVSEGGSLLVIPSEDQDVSGINSFLSSSGISPLLKMDTTKIRVSEVNTTSPLFSDVFEKKGGSEIPENADLPIITRHFVSAVSSKSNSESLMRLQNGDVYLSVTPVSKGKIYLLYGSLNESSGNFPKNSLFVPAIYKIALLSQPDIPLFNTIPADEGIAVTGDSVRNKEVVKLKKEDSDFEIIPEIRRDGQNASIFVHGQISEAGNYLLMSDKQVLRPVSFNYNRKESDLQYVNPEEISTSLEKAGGKGAVLNAKASVLGKQIKEMSQGVPLWKYFIIAGLLFLLTEVLLVRLMKD